MLFVNAASDYVSMYKQMKHTMQSEYKERSEPYKLRIIKWNSEQPITRIDKPTNVARARELGYKAKEGVVMVRVMLHGGSRKRKHAAGGRKPSKSGRYFTNSKSLRAIAEERAARKFTNCEALNSYFVGSAGSKTFFEVILLDKNHPAILSDPQLNGVAKQNGRAFRGLSSIGKRHRGLSRKRFGAHKIRPSQNKLKT
jgi:large subunit ribosomal protein L15e